MLGEFKKFAVRGNVLDLAIGVIIGAAFGKIVSSLVDDIIMPPIGVVLSVSHAQDFQDWCLPLGAAARGSVHSSDVARLRDEAWYPHAQLRPVRKQRDELFDRVVFDLSDGPPDQSHISAGAKDAQDVPMCRAVAQFDQGQALSELHLRSAAARVIAKRPGGIQSGPARRPVARPAASSASRRADCQPPHSILHRDRPFLFRRIAQRLHPLGGPIVTQLSPSAALASMVTGYWVSQSVYVAAKLSLADLVKSGPQSAEHLAAATDTQPAALYRLLRALASVGVFREDDRRRFAMTPIAELFASSDSPGSQRAFVIMGGEEHFRCWGELLYSIRTGKTAFDKIYGEPIFDWMAKHPEQAANFDQAMVGVHGRERRPCSTPTIFPPSAPWPTSAAAMAACCGPCSPAIPRCAACSAIWPESWSAARPLIAADGLADRLQIVVTNFFESVPAGADAYLMRHIIHDWNDEQSLTILRNVPSRHQERRPAIARRGDHTVGQRAQLFQAARLEHAVDPRRQGTHRRRVSKTLRGRRISAGAVIQTSSDVSVIEGRPV